jgi:hypothetical protein
MEEIQAWIDNDRRENKEREQRERLAEQQGSATPSSQPPKKAAAPRPAPVEWPPVAEAGAVPGMASSRQAAAEASAAAAVGRPSPLGGRRRQRRLPSARPASRRGSTLLPPRSGSGQLRRGRRPTRRWMPPGRRALTHHLCWKRMRRCRRHGRSRRNGSAGAAADRRADGFRPADQSSLLFS